MSEANLFAQQQANRRRAAILVAIFIAFFAWIGFGGDWVMALETAGARPGEYRHRIPLFGIATTLLGVGLTLAAWKRGPKQVLWATGATEIVDPQSPEERRLVNVVEEMAIASGLPKPRIWLVPDDDPNALATGMHEREAHVLVTRGLLKALDRDELQAVVAHELAHIRNYDVKLMTLLAALVGTIALVSEGVGRMLRSGGRGRSGRRAGRGEGGGLAMIVLAVWLATVLLAPLISRLLALAVSRKREFLADATAAQFTRNPAALAAALRKIEDHAAPTKSVQHATAHLCIADPLGRRVSRRQGWWADLVGTHPPMAVRIARLEAMAYQHDRTGTLSQNA